jgi:hypothetical protein
MKKLLAILLILTTLPTRPMDPTTTKDMLMVGGVLASLLIVGTYHVYKRFNPTTIEDFKREKEASDRDAMKRLETGRQALEAYMKEDKYRDRCLEAGKILEK